MRSHCVTRCWRAVATVASESDFVPDKRLHPLSWLFALLAFIRQFIVPLIVIVVFDVRDDGSAWGALFVIPLAVAALWRQFLFRYGFGPRGLVIREGLFFRNVRKIEYERIENVDTQRGILHRLMNVAEVRLESSTGGKPEALIRVLGDAAVQELRERIFSGTHHEQAAPTTHAAAERSGEVLLKLPPAELVRYGFVDNRGMIVVAAIFGVWAQTGAMQGIGHYLTNEVFTNGAGTLGLSLLLVAVGVFVTIVLVVRSLSLLWALVTLHDFTLSRYGGDLRIRYGLLTRVTLTLRLPRIQAVHRTETFLHRFFGRVSLAVDLAGDGGQQVDEHGSPQNHMRWLAPICTPRQSVEIARIALPMIEQDSAPQWQPLAPGAKLRVFRRFFLVATIVCAVPAVFWLQYRAPLVWLVIVPWGWMHATLYVRHTRWALTRKAILYQRGWLTRRLSIVPRNRVQVVQEIVSPFDRRRRMATLVVDTAGASALTGIMRIRYLPVAEVRRVARELYVSAEDFAPRRAAAAGRG
jgi:putative membrane protein